MNDGDNTFFHEQPPLVDRTPPSDMIRGRDHRMGVIKAAVGGVLLQWSVMSAVEEPWNWFSKHNPINSPELALDAVTGTELVVAGVIQNRKALLLFN